ncbi:hypothetical protein J2T12_005612 [Paenibacillus anaericanus]|nr:hypothetical protein [Paenibacillus anaericanus]
MQHARRHEVTSDGFLNGVMRKYALFLAAYITRADVQHEMKPIAEFF